MDILKPENFFLFQVHQRYHTKKTFGGIIVFRDDDILVNSSENETKPVAKNVTLNTDRIVFPSD